MSELLTPKQMAEVDRLAIQSGVSGLVLMERAGRAVAERAMSLLPARGRVVVLAGPGNNGGDGYVAASVLAKHGYPVRVLTITGVPSHGDAAVMAERWKGETAPATAQAALDGDLLIDAMFGAGLNRPLDASTIGLVEAVNAAGIAVLAVYLPSGINGDSGAVMGAAIQARATVTFFRRKPGHLLMPGRLYCGDVHIAEIGIPVSVLGQIAPQLTTNDLPLWRTLFPLPQPGGHKYDRGHAVVVSGGLTGSSAARLAARGALRAGAGLVTLASPRDALAVNVASSLSVMVKLAADARQLAKRLSDRRVSAAVVGPGHGGGPKTQNAVLTALKSAAAVVLDADALTCFERQPARLFKAIASRKPATVLTPHEGEFKRLFSKIAGDSKLNSKVEKTLAAASVSKAVFVLKGPDTVVAAPDGRAAIAANAPPWLATAGAGDVLAGMIAGLAAQGMPAFEAAAAGVWLHGEAANAFGPGLIAEDLPEALPGVLRRLFTG